MSCEDLGVYRGRVLPGSLVCLDPSSGVSGDVPLMLTSACSTGQVCCWLPRGGLGLVLAVEAGALLLLTAEGVGWTGAGALLRRCG